MMQSEDFVMLQHPAGSPCMLGESGQRRGGGGRTCCALGWRMGMARTSPLSPMLITQLMM